MFFFHKLPQTIDPHLYICCRFCLNLPETIDKSSPVKIGPFDPKGNEPSEPLVFGKCDTPRKIHLKRKPQETCQRNALERIGEENDVGVITPKNHPIKKKKNT